MPAKKKNKAVEEIDDASMDENLSSDLDSDPDSPEADESEEVTEDTGDVVNDTDDVSTEDVSIEEELAAALKKADENWDLMLRTKAEMENLRRRNQKDVENAHKYGLEKLINELIPLKEGLEMALAVDDASVESLHEGMELTLKTFSNIFEKMSVEEINPEGEKFDPELHQAMTMQPSDEIEPNTVLEVLQKGYRLNDRLLRPAMVIVSKKA